MLRLKLTPLTRLTAAFDAELNLMADSGKEGKPPVKATGQAA